MQVLRSLGKIKTIPITTTTILRACANGGLCKLGDTGPGGGVVFYVSDSKQPWGSYLEVKQESVSNAALGSQILQWDAAVSEASSYRGGGLSDWRLPTKEESLSLRKTYTLWGYYWLAEDANYFWSSTRSATNANRADCTQWVTGWQATCERSDFLEVRLIRNF
jgi:hypothetical protein